MSIYNTELFIKRAREKHGLKYSYELVCYINSRGKVIIVCPIHGNFSQIADNHLRGQNCPKCANIIRSAHQYKNTLHFIKKSRNIHGDTYCYDKVVYKHHRKKVIITCPIHGDFTQTPHQHYAGRACPDCGNIYTGDALRKSAEQFIRDANIVHKSQYQYDAIKYKNNRLKIAIICTKHGIFFQSPSNHLAGNGCPKCKSSKGENKILEFLAENSISFCRQVKIPGCENMLPLRFDFGLYENNNLVGLVEFHGKQHFKPIAYYGGEKAFDKQKKRDTIKVDFCFRNDIALLIIPYNDYQKIDWLLDKFWKDIISETKRTLATRFSCRM